MFDAIKRALGGKRIDTGVQIFELVPCSGGPWLGYVANAYRVLLTRGRQGMVVFVPEGSNDDATRAPAAYDAIHAFLVACGFDPLMAEPAAEVDR